MVAKESVEATEKVSEKKKKKKHKKQKCASSSEVGKGGGYRYIGWWIPGMGSGYGYNINRVVGMGV